MVQSGGNQPVAAIPAKFVEPEGAATGSLPGASAGAIVSALNSVFLPLSSARCAVTFGNFAFGAALFRDSNASLEIG